jgi:hypothetical protein
MYPKEPQVNSMNQSKNISQDILFTANQIAAA